MKRLTLFITALIVSTALNAQNRSPNVLIFMVDDIGQGDIGAYNPTNKTLSPNIDKLSQGGVSFHHAHSPASVCAPSRYALLTGNHVYRGKLPKGTWGHEEANQILPDQQTLADQLGKNGYHTAFFGKVHMGGYANVAEGTYKDGPFDHGFDHSLALVNGIQAPPYAFFKNGKIARFSDGDFKQLTKAQISKHLVDLKGVKKKGKQGKKMDNYTTQSVGPLLMRDALSFLDNHYATQADKPFYIHYMSQAGHTPHKPPVAFNVKDPLDTENLTKNGAISVKGQTVNQRTDMVYESDVAIGLFVEKLRELGQLENTIIIYTSDNGAGKPKKYTWNNKFYKDYKDGEYGGDRIEFQDKGDKKVSHINAQGIGLDGKALRGKKGYVYEGGHRVPFIWHWAGNDGANAMFPANIRITDQMISLSDVYRTVSTLAGIRVPDNQAVDSYDFSHVLMDPKPISSKNPPIRAYMAIQANRRAESQQAVKKKGHSNKSRYAWSFYNYDADYKLWTAIISKKEDKEVLEVEGDELYLLSDDEDESENIKDAQPKLMNSLVDAYTNFLKRPITHKGQLSTPPAVLKWMKGGDFLVREH